jgi:perosamine synthetase
MATVFFPTWPQLNADDIRAVQRVLESSRLSQLSSPAVCEFEEAFAELHGGKHCIALNSGTAAIHAALAALDVGQGDEVIVPSHTFIGSASPILYQRAKPMFADVDDKSYCLSPASVEALVTPRTKAIIAVHLNGHPAPLDAILAYADRHRIAIIEDVAQALGGRYWGRRLGTLGRVSCFSFWEDKIITMGGEGGAILTDDDDVATRIRRIRQHGEELSPETGLYSSRELGYNYRLTAMQAALGRSQLTHLDDYIAARRSNASRLSAGLRDVQGLETPSEAGGCTHAYWKYVCRLQAERFRVPISSLVTELQVFGIPAYPRYPIPLHRQPVFEISGHGGQDCPAADRLAKELFSLPVHPALSNDHIDYMIERVQDLLKAHVI